MPVTHMGAAAEVERPTVRVPSSSSVGAVRFVVTLAARAARPSATVGEETAAVTVSIGLAQPVRASAEAASRAVHLAAIVRVIESPRVWGAGARRTWAHGPANVSSSQSADLVFDPTLAHRGGRFGRRGALHY